MDNKRFTTTLLMLVVASTLLCGCYPKRVGPIGPEGKKLTWAEMNLSERKAHMLLGPEFARAPETTSLKLNRLVPEMSAALGVKPFSIISRKGFGCYSCHLGPDGAMYGN